MSILSFGLAAARTASTESQTEPKRKNAFQRWADAWMEARMRRAMEEIKRHRHLLPRDLERAGWQITERSEDSLPFRR